MQCEKRIGPRVRTHTDPSLTRGLDKTNQQTHPRGQNRHIDSSRGMWYFVGMELPKVRKPWKARKHSEARRKHVDLALSEQELAQVDQCARDMQWTRSDVIRNCLANGTKDIETFVKGCDSPVISTAWRLALMLSVDDERQQILAAMDTVTQTRSRRHADLLEPDLYEDQVATA